MDKPEKSEENQSQADKTRNNFTYNSDSADLIEKKWQKNWAKNKTYNIDSINLNKKPYYTLDMFPYPSGYSLHIGHLANFTPTDVFARYKRMKNFHVLHAMGYDAFGLPAERYAINNNEHPAVSTQKNIDNMRSQLTSVGMGYDTDRSISTIDPQFYKWTQWIFIQLFNSYYDDTEDKAKPIQNIIDRFENGTLTASSGKSWNVLSEKEQYDELAKYRLAYLEESTVNWCPRLGTVLGDEEVSPEGKSEIGDFPVLRLPLTQWNLRITKYADRLVSGLEDLDWPSGIKTMQKNWVGKSEGAYVNFKLSSPMEELKIKVFTTRVDTQFGVTFLVVAPEHNLIEELSNKNLLSEEAQSYIDRAINKTEVQRLEGEKDKTGVLLDVKAINPVNGKEVPVYVADYVLAGYGTGAVMGVPAHDGRDFEFAKKYDLEIIPVIEPDSKWVEETGADPKDIATWSSSFLAKSNDVKLINSGDFNGLGVLEAIETITEYLENTGHAKRTTTYKIRDWLFSRQRFWGEPFPILWDSEGVAHPVPEDALPVELPVLEDFSIIKVDENAKTPTPPLSNIEDWVNVEIDLGDGKGKRKFTREVNVMPQWAGSSWYYFRYLDPHCDTAFVSKDVLSYWQDQNSNNDKALVDFYIGGAEHAIGHLLYSRFWHKVLYDLGYVNTPEPFQKLTNQGMLQAASYKDSRGFYVAADQVNEVEGKYIFTDETGQDEVVSREFGKMGKSLKNGVDPLKVMEQYSADTVRLYILYMGPVDSSKIWSQSDVIGMFRFLQKVYRLLVDEDTGKAITSKISLSPDDESMIHKTILKVNADIESLSFNTAIAQLIECVNYFTSNKSIEGINEYVAETLVKLLTPFVPHFAEELWEKLGHSDTVVYETFPEGDESKAQDETVEVPVQINGKVRVKLQAEVDMSKDELLELAKSNERIVELLADKSLVKEIVIPNRLVNLVVK